MADFSQLDFGDVGAVLNFVENVNGQGGVLGEDFWLKAITTMSIESPAGSTALLYTGATQDLVRDLVGYNPTKFSQIADTDLGKLLNSDDAINIFNRYMQGGGTFNGISDIRDATGGAHLGSIWGLTSHRFATSASGDVYAFLDNADPNRVFGKVELDALLNNPRVTSINGIAIEDIRRMPEGQRFGAIQAQYRFSASYLFAEAYSEGKIRSVRDLRRFYTDAGIDYRNNDFYQYALEGRRAATRNNTQITDFKAFSQGMKLLGGVGTIADIANVVVIADQIAALHNQGRHDEARNLLQDSLASGFGGALGGAVGGRAGALIAVALVGILIPEPSSTAIGVATLVGMLGGGYVGGEIGAALGQDVIDALQAKLASGEELTSEDFIMIIREAEHSCFAAGTQITMWDGSKKAIELIEADDIVMSYDAKGAHVPGRVTQTFVNSVTVLLDLFGTKVTPGHVSLCGDGVFAGRHVPMIDILRSDGALVLTDGTKVRAATGAPLGTPADQMVVAVTGDLAADGTLTETSRGAIRAGTRVILSDGRDISVYDLILAAGATVTADGMIDTGAGPMPFHWHFASQLPNPEDYVLARSKAHLADIYAADEWEGVGPQLPAPMGAATKGSGPMMQ